MDIYVTSYYIFHIIQRTTMYLKKCCFETSNSLTTLNNLMVTGIWSLFKDFYLFNTLYLYQ